MPFDANVISWTTWIVCLVRLVCLSLLHLDRRSCRWLFECGTEKKAQQGMPNNIALPLSLYPHILNTRNTFKWTQPLYSHFRFIFLSLIFHLWHLFLLHNQKHIHTHEHILSFRLSALNVYNMWVWDVGASLFFIISLFSSAIANVLYTFRLRHTTVAQNMYWVAKAMHSIAWNCVNLLPVTNSIPRSHSLEWVCVITLAVSLLIFASFAWTRF